MCVLLWSVIISILLIFAIIYPSCKSSDLFMINPHISLNLWNPLIHGAILRFNEDFYCEIHGFCEQSSDLAVDLSKSSSRSEGYFIFFVWVSVLWLEVAFYTISDCPTFLSDVMCSIWKLDFQIWTQITALIWLWDHICIVVPELDSPLNFYSIHPVHHEILHVWGEILRFTCKSLDKSSDFTDFINPWIYQIYLRTLIFPSSPSSSVFANLREFHIV